ncbi:HEAT repeat protein [Pseudobythopirellula maris]|uniref:HEAT repeat protein n=1 Tax=Pseudobythopirellula maris TaxID=2527991 RepID=A0A5C5ZU38_9BACT|nr:HEAT repeat domain-containing protein [Pseudobythopirellula maris]TWT89633.1 HEAT repeat protein [Pseudobythopirellula maris]
MAAPLAGIETTLHLLKRWRHSAAGDVLLAASFASHPRVRIGALRTLVRREDPAAHAKLIADSDGLDEESRRELIEAPEGGALRKAVQRAISSSDASLSRQACRLASEGRMLDALPAVVKAARQFSVSVAAGHAEAALLLAKELHGEIALRRRGKRGRLQSDPAFLRRAALVELGEALDQYDLHRRDELIEAFLLLTAHDSPTMLRVIHNPRHAGHEPLLNALRDSPTHAAWELVARSLEDRTAPAALLEVAAQRTDRSFVESLLTEVGSPVGIRTLDNAKKIDRFAWLAAEHREALYTMRGDAQAAALQLGAASQMPREELAGVAFDMLSHGAPEGRLAAVLALDSVPPSECAEPLLTAAADSDPHVASAAAQRLRKKKHPQAMPILLSMLESRSSTVRKAAQRALPEVNFIRYRDQYDGLSEEHRRDIGELVGKADARAAQRLRQEFAAGAVSRRLRALEMTEAMGYVDQVRSDLMRLMEDSDLGVRAEAARVLGSGRLDADTLVALDVRRDDVSAEVRKTAAESADRLRALDAAQSMIDELQQEFDP